MPNNPAQAADPRTVSRKLVGVFDAVFPRLLPGIVGHMNRNLSRTLEGIEPVSDKKIQQSTLQRAMLFEIAIAASELMQPGQDSVDWQICLARAARRQEKFYDACIPTKLELVDKEISLHVAHNLIKMLKSIEMTTGCVIRSDPRIPGFGWISTGVGDYSSGNSIIEIKCTCKRFTSADYRQIAMYWLLSYIDSLEKGTQPWVHGVLLNPRNNTIVEFRFDEFIPLISGGRSAIEVVQVFSAFITQASPRET